MMQEFTTADSSDSQILHPGSRQLFSQWEMLRAEQACPLREDFSLAAVKAYMPDMLVIDRDYLRNSFKYRLVGTRVCSLFGSNLTGANVLSGWDNFEADVIGRHLITVFNQKQPAVIRMRMTTDMGQIVAAEMIALPVLMRGTERVQIIGGLFPFRAAQSLGHQAIMKRELVSARVIWTEHESVEQASDISRQVQPIRHAMRNFTLIDGGKV
jgi:hypothetical protein